jgi:hypothetical protein
MGKRIPDITFGLFSYESGDPDDEGVDERERRIRRCLKKSRLSHNIYKTDEFSLITDPKWGQHTLLFPFAVYEAKRDQKSELQVKLQLKLAFNAYLHMLDSLIRQPGKDESTSRRRPGHFRYLALLLVAANGRCMLVICLIAFTTMSMR